MDPEKTVQLPQPDEISEREKEDAMGAYLMMFGALGAGLPLPFLSLIAAIIYHVLNSKKSKFVAFHSLQSLLTESMVSTLNAAAVIWAVWVWLTPLRAGISFYSFCIFALFWNLMYIAFSVVACVKARHGQFYYFWVFGRISFAHTFMRSPKQTGSLQNLPPGGL